MSAASNDAGFTIVEVLAAMFLFVGLSTATVTATISMLNTLEQNNERVFAANVARSQIETLRTLGVENIPIGLSTSAPEGTPPGYTVETSAEWVGLGQTASSCQDASPGQSYLRVHVAVTSPNLDDTSATDTIITPDTAPSDPGTGAVTIEVIDQNNNPVSGIQVTAADAQHPENVFVYTTGVDGCLFVPGLTAPSTLVLTVDEDGYVPSTPTGDTVSVQLDADNLSRATFHYAPAASIMFTSMLPDYPLDAGMPVTWQVNETGSPVLSAEVGAPVLNQWPTTSGFTAWAGDCDDADPEEYEGQRQSFDFVAGEETGSGLGIQPVRLVGLVEGVTLSARHVGGGCTEGPFALGSAGANGKLLVGIPFGSWEFTADDGETSETVTPSAPFGPPSAGEDPEAVAVQFTAWGPFFCPEDSDHPEKELDHAYDAEADRESCYDEEAQ